MLTPSTHAAWFRGTGGPRCIIRKTHPCECSCARWLPQTAPAGGRAPFIGANMSAIAYVLAFLVIGCLAFAFLIAALIVGGRG